MSDSISRVLAIIDDRLDALHALMTDEPIDVVTERYRAWKGATFSALADVVVESVVIRFDAVRGAGTSADARHRPTPQVYLDGAASRDFLNALTKQVEADPGAVLRLPLSEPPPNPRQRSILKIVGLLERRLPGAFRGRPERERDIQDGFETLLAGAEIAYERTDGPDFTFPELQAALELKLCDGPAREKEILAEMHDEIPAFRAKYSQIIFGIYDLGFIQDTARFVAAFEAQDGVLVRVIKPQASMR